VTPTTIVLGPNGGMLTLKASFGSVDWSIAESSSLVGHVTVSPTAGTLASGQSTTVTLSVSGPPGTLSTAARADGGGGGCGGDHDDGGGGCTEGTLTVNPDGITVTVILDIGDDSGPPPSSPPPGDANPRGLAGRLVD
jgi:hypothetical protein